VIPQTIEFDDFFKSLTITENLPSEAFRIHPIALSGGLPPVYLAQTTEGKISWEGYENKVTRFLANHDFLVNDEIVKVVTAIFIFRNRDEKNLPDKFNKMILNSITLKANHFFLLPTLCPDDFQNFELDRFRIAKFDSEKFKYRLKKAECAIPLIVDSLEGWFSISGNELSVKSIKPNIDIRTKFEMNIWQVYFDSMAALSFGNFWKKLEYLQSLLLPLGGVDFPGNSLRAIPRSMSITLFVGVNEASKGFVCLEANLQMFIGLIGLDKHTIAAKNRYEELGFKLEEDFPIHPSIKLVLDMYQVSSRHLSNGHVAEGFLNYIIALEVLFADRAGIADTISKRAATLTFKALSKDLRATVQFYKDIYAERSKFVHSGICGIDLERISLLKAGVAEAIACAYRVSRSNAGFEMEVWRNNIDLLNLTINLKKEAHSALFKDCGLIPN
jgi:hypothetical protein